MNLDTLSAKSNLEYVNFKFWGSFKFFKTRVAPQLKVFGEGNGVLLYWKPR